MSAFETNRFQRLFDPDQAMLQQQAGINLAATAPRVETWRDRAEQALGDLAAADQPFTADDLVARVGLPDEGINRNNAVGAIINGAARRRLIRKTGEYRRAERVASHARILAVWIGW